MTLQSRGLPSRVCLPTGERREVQWGVAETSTQRESVMVGHDMRR